RRPRAVPPVGGGSCWPPSRSGWRGRSAWPPGRRPWRCRGCCGSTRRSAPRTRPSCGCARAASSGGARARPIVRTFRAERSQTVLVLLDNGRTMAGRVDGVPRVEHAVDAVMMLTAVATGLGDRCGVVAFDREVRAAVPPGGGKAQLGRVIEALYELDPVLVESDYAGAFAETLARLRRGAVLVGLTGVVPAGGEEWVVAVRPLVGVCRVVVVAGVRDPDVARWAPGAGGDAAGVYRRAAAVG